MITEAGIKAAIRNAPTTAGAVELKDDGGRGEGRLMLLVQVTGERVATQWYAVWWRDGRRRLRKIGNYPTMSLADARKAFQKDYRPAILAGDNPAGPRERRKRIGVTIGDMFDAYAEHLETTEKASAKNIKRVLDLAAADFGPEKRAADITKDNIREHLADIHGRGAVSMAQQTRSYLHAAFAWAMRSANSYTSAAGSVDWGLGHNPVSAVPPDPDAEKVGERFLRPAELRAFWNWLKSGVHESAVSAVPLLMMATGQRMTEFLRITKDTYDREEAMLDWSKTKNGQPHAIPLPRQAVEVLDSLPVSRSGQFFPHSRRPDEHATIGAVERVIQEYLEKTGAAHFTARDLRRTWKTLSGAAGITKEVRDRIQNHAKSDVSSRHYDRYDYLVEKRAGMKTWEAYLDRILAGELDNPVTKLNVGGAA